MKRPILMHSAWGDFSRKFVRAQDLPHGTALHLYDTTTGRKKRSDWQVKRRRIRHARRIDDDATVSVLLRTARKLLSTDIEARRLTMYLVGPSGDVVQGNTRVKTIRAFPPRPTERERAAEEQWREVIDYQRREVADIASAELRQAENGVDDPHEVVPHGYVHALLDRYGRDELLSAVDAMSRSTI